MHAGWRRDAVFRRLHRRSKLLHLLLIRHELAATDHRFTRAAEMERTDGVTDGRTDGEVLRRGGRGRRAFHRLSSPYRR